MHAECCPVCGGLGKVQSDVICHGCGGRGWVEVRDEQNQKPEIEKKFVTNPIDTRTIADGHRDKDAGKLDGE